MLSAIVATWCDGAAAPVEASFGVFLTDQLTVTRSPATLAREATAALLERYDELRGRG